MRTIHRSCHRCPFPKPPPLLQATAVTPPGRKPIFHLPRHGIENKDALMPCCRVHYLNLYCLYCCTVLLYCLSVCTSNFQSNSNPHSLSRSHPPHTHTHRTVPQLFWGNKELGMADGSPLQNFP